MKLSKIKQLAHAAEHPHEMPDDTDVIMLGHQTLKLIEMVRSVWFISQAEKLDIEMDMPLPEDEEE